MPNAERKPTIFISHSSANVKVAQAVRNTLEDLGHRASLIDWLQFKSPDDDQLIYQLLEGEIKNRDWLLLVDTPESQASSWVEFELETAKKYNKVFYRINGHRFDSKNRSEMEDAIARCTTKFSRSVRIFISYSQKEAAKATQISRYLKSRGYESWVDFSNLRAGDDWAATISHTLDEVIEWGVILFMVSQAGVASHYVHSEIEYVRRKNGVIIPILSQEIALVRFPLETDHYQYLDMSKEPIADAAFDQLTRAIDDYRTRTLAEFCS